MMQCNLEAWGFDLMRKTLTGAGARGGARSVCGLYGIYGRPRQHSLCVPAHPHHHPGVRVFQGQFNILQGTYSIQLLVGEV